MGEQWNYFDDTSSDVDLTVFSDDDINAMKQIRDVHETKIEVIQIYYLLVVLFLTYIN